MAHRDEHGNAPIVYAHLSDLLSAGQVLVLHRSSGLLLHLMYEQGEPHLQCVEQLTPEEGQAPVPLLQVFPACVSDAPVLASIEERAVEEAQERLNTALQGETPWTASLYPLQTVLWNLRRKLQTCRIALVAVQRRGSLLNQWKEHL